MTRTGEQLLAFLEWLEAQDQDDPAYKDLDKQGLVNAYLKANPATVQEIGA